VHGAIFSLQISANSSSVIVSIMETAGNEIRRFPVFMGKRANPVYFPKQPFPNF
jgi:hypothetical protein